MQRACHRFIEEEATQYTRVSTGKRTNWMTKNTRTHSLTKAYSLEAGALPPAWANSHKQSSSLICRISCIASHCSLSFWKTLAFLCFQSIHDVRIVNVSNFRLLVWCTLFRVSNHQDRKLLSRCGATICRPAYCRQPNHTTLAKTHCVCMWSTLSSS
jgi:hypothetical protein